MFKIPLLGLVAAVALAGCAVPKPALLSVKEESFFGPQAAAPHDFKASWYAGANPELKELFSLALRDNPGLAAVSLRKEAAKASDKSALFRLLPTGQAQVVAGRKSKESGFMAEFQPSTYPYGNAAASWELPLFGRAEGIWAQGRAQNRRMAALEQSAQLSLLSDIFQAYARAGAATKRHALLLQMLSRDVESQEAMAMMYEKRLVTLEDRAAANKQTLSTTVAVRTADSERNKAIAALQALTAEPNLSVHFSEGLPALEAPAPAPQWMRDRPDVWAAEAAVAEAAASVGVARSDFWPQLTLGGTMSKTPGMAHTSTETFGITMPLLSWFSTRANVDAKLAEMRGTVFSYRDSVLQAWRESLQAHEDLKLSAARLEDVVRLQVDADDILKAQVRAYDFGAVSKAEVQRAKGVADSARLDALDAHAAHQLAWAMYQKAVFSRYGRS